MVTRSDPCHPSRRCKLPWSEAGTPSGRSGRLGCRWECAVVRQVTASRRSLAAIGARCVRIPPRVRPWQGAVAGASVAMDLSLVLTFDDKVGRAFSDELHRLSR